MGHSVLANAFTGGVVCVSGAGDCFAAAFISSALRAASQDEAVAAGIQVGSLLVIFYFFIPNPRGPGGQNQLSSLRNISLQKCKELFLRISVALTTQIL